jgi:predicted enzyme related to lactoylglutathione lyase
MEGPSSQESTMFLGLRTAIYPAPDLSSAKHWYEQVLGVKPYFDQPYYVGFSVGGFELGLLPDGIPSTDGPQPWWGVADVKAEYARLLALGATELQPATDVGEGIKVAAVKDPFGNRVGIIENPNFKISEVR